MIQTIKIPIGRFYRKLFLTTYKNRVYAAFQFNRTLVNEVKAMRGSKWHGDAVDIPDEVRRILQCTKCWSFDLCERNQLSLQILQGDDPYVVYLEPPKPIEAEPRRTINNKILTPFPHQCLMTGHHLQCRRVITAAEMGVGKTLAAIMTMERAENPDHRDFWYVSTRSGLMATELELRLWRAGVIPLLFTYQQLVSTLQVDPEIRVPQLIIFDESAAIKNITAQRTQAAMFIAQRMRRECRDPYIIEMCGAPQPQSPVDWWTQAEVAAPGFLREGHPTKLEQRLSFSEVGHNGAYLKKVSWRDDTRKCDKCGTLRDEHDGDDHPWKPSKDEVTHLGHRLRGLVLTVRKADVVPWLPKKIYREITVKPNSGTLRAAKLIASSTLPVIQKLTHLRMLSDGFRYKISKTSQTKLCPSCLGEGSISDYDPEQDEIVPVTCPECHGANAVAVEQRTAEFMTCPKDDALKDCLDECEGHGRCVVYAGFTGSVDRCVNLAVADGWDVIRADGRGWHALGPRQGLLAKQNLLEAFQLNRRDHPKMVFIGQAGAAGTGITLNASEMIVYYSNDFDANHRIQSQARIDRIGSTGIVIVDLIHLESDRIVLDAIKRKINMQKIVLDASIFNRRPNDGIPSS